MSPRVQRLCHASLLSRMWSEVVQNGLVEIEIPLKRIFSNPSMQPEPEMTQTEEHLEDRVADESGKPLDELD